MSAQSSAPITVTTPADRAEVRRRGKPKGSTKAPAEAARAESVETLVYVPVAFGVQVYIAKVKSARREEQVDIREYRVLKKKPGWTRRKGFRVPATPAALRKLADGLSRVADPIERPETPGIEPRDAAAPPPPKKAASRGR